MCNYETEYCKNHRHCVTCEHFVNLPLTNIGKTIPNVGDIVYYCYDLFGEHLTLECTVEEITLNREGIKSIYIVATNKKSSYHLTGNTGIHSLQEVAFTKEDANKWLEMKN